MNIAEPLRELFMRCGYTWNDSIIPFQACIIQIFKDWERMDFSDECPIHFSSTEIASHEHELSDYEKWQEIQGFVRKYLDTDAEARCLQKQTRRKTITEHDTPWPPNRAFGS